MNFINLTVEGINQEGNRIIIKSGGKSYSFFVTKQDGTQSRAYQDYMKLGVMIGKTFSFGVTESIGKSQDGRAITYRNIGVIGEARGSVSSQEAQGGAYQPQVVPTPQNEIKYQTMSDFEVKALAELNRLATGYEKLFNAIKTIELALPEEIRNAMQIHESDNQLENLQKVGLAPESLKDIPVIEDVKSEDVPF